MIRFVLSLLAVILIGGATFVGARSLIDRGAEAKTLSAASVRRSQLSQELDRWRARTTTLADRDAAAEAQRTLDLIGRLYEQEDRLWAYYQAVDAGVTQRTRLVEEQIERERIIREQERLGHELEQSLARLRPTGSESIDFTTQREQH
jgi:hypothetical protein